MTNTTLFEKNKFYKKVFEDIQGIVKKELKKGFIGRPEKSKSWEKLSEKEKFLMRTIFLLYEIDQKIEELNYCLVFINSYPKTRLWEKTFFRSDYVRYHLEVYYGNIVGLHDRCLLLVNHMYALGLKPQDVNQRIICSNSNLKDEPVLEVLKLFERGLKNIRTLRNFIAHRGSLSDDKLNDIKTAEFVHTHSESLSEKEKKQIKFLLIKFRFSQYISRKKKEIKRNNETLLTLTDNLLDALQGKYNQSLKGFE